MSKVFGTSCVIVLCSRYPNADGGESDGDSVSSDDGRDGFDLPELLICLRALQPLYHPATTLSHCVQLKCYKYVLLE